MISDSEKQAEEEACDDSSDNSHTWIQWFCDLEGHDFFVEVHILIKHKCDKIYFFRFI